MRLLNVEKFQLEEYFEPNVPPYVILSHTWDTDEVLFRDIQPAFDGTFESLAWSNKKGARKVFDSAVIAAKKGYKYIWIDTCCIDKSSSSELSEAINSMFNWYIKANICFENHDIKDNDRQSYSETLKESRWFTRGWTLQELIAPHEVQFYDRNWHFFGTRVSLSETLQTITNIAIEVLVFGTLGIQERAQRLPRFLKRYSVWEKMVWAAARETSRVEDTAYSLLGTFDINMPLLYGEGPRAFNRLLKKIMKQTDDHSVLFFRRHKIHTLGS
ncbi:HET-domain-containing protein [Xylariaceae sp. FL1019]|nr:HET-domain-containing protein [Xylariaceae sp. FL1019]